MKRLEKIKRCIDIKDTWLFSGTVRDNLRYSNPNATDEEVMHAADVAQAGDFIRSLPDGLDSYVAQGGTNFSGGQKQLLTIARVFLCDPPILILDEATSSVDTRTEVEIGKAMKKLMKGRTSFVIAHRLSTIRDADMILFMEKGNIIEQEITKNCWQNRGLTQNSITASLNKKNLKGAVALVIMQQRLLTDRLKNI